MKHSKVIYYIGAIFLAGVVALIYLSDDQTKKTESLVALGYFESNQEFVDTVYSKLQPNIKKEKYFWFGIEPGIASQLELFGDLKKSLEKENGVFDLVYVDQELKLSIEAKNLFGNTIECEVKNDWSGVAKAIQKNADKKILVLTAAVYSTNFLKENPIHKIKTATELQPITFSMGHFAVNTEDEKKNVFSCVTDDKEGVAAWGCMVLNKARSQRRKIDMNKVTGQNPSMVGLMDSTSEKDYMILIR